MVVAAAITKQNGEVFRPRFWSVRRRSKAVSNEFVEQAFVAWSSHDPDKVLAFYIDDVVFEDVPLGVTQHGRGKLRECRKDVCSRPRLKVEVVRGSICDGPGVAECRNRRCNIPRRFSRDGTG
jgi:hypothetical protein